MSDSPIVKAQVDVYRPAVLEHGDSPRATFHVKKELQQLRFDRLIDPLIRLKTPFSIHDVGAGFCDLHAHLEQRGVEHAYSATEIVPEMVEIARSKYPGVNVQLRDLLAEMPADRHDFVVVNGTFNIPGSVPHEEWTEFVHAMLERMFAMCDRAIAVNFLSGHRTYTDPDLFYLDAGELLSFCQSRLSRFVTIDHAYPLYEYTAIIERPEAVEASYPGDPFGKYFRAK